MTGDGSRPVAARILLGSAWVGLATVLLLLRQAGAPAVDTMWAEDGEVFLSGAVRRGALAPLFSPYAGYFNAVPRLAAGLVSVVPLGLAAMLFAVGSAAVVGSLSVYVYGGSRDLLTSRWLRVLLAAMVVLLPALAWESMNNATNLQWSLILPCFLALIAVPVSRSETIASAAVAAVVAATVPTTLLMVPLAAVRLARRTSPSAGVVASAFLVGAGAQVLMVILAARDPFGAASEPLDLPGLYGLRVAGSLLAGEWVLPTAWRGLGPAFGYGMLVVAASLVSLAIVRRPDRRSTIGLAAGSSVALFCFPVLVRGTSLLTPVGEHLDLSIGSKWVIGPILLLTLALFMGFEPREPRGWPRSSAAVVVALALVIAIALLRGFRVENARSNGPRWSAEIAAARGRCRGGASNASIPIPPPGWEVEVPCARLGG
jgi:hypothetical protein